MRKIFLALAMALGCGPVLADGFQPVQDKGAFLSLVEGRELRLGASRIALKVLPDGTIQGRALGWDITGTWSWNSGFFCREMDWSGYPIPPNCQLVEQRGTEMRFTSDKGSGQSAAFKLR